MEKYAKRIEVYRANSKSSNHITNRCAVTVKTSNQKWPVFCPRMKNLMSKPCTTYA